MKRDCPQVKKKWYEMWHFGTTSQRAPDLDQWNHVPRDLGIPKWIWKFRMGASEVRLEPWGWGWALEGQPLWEKLLELATGFFLPKLPSDSKRPVTVTDKHGPNKQSCYGKSESNLNPIYVYVRLHCLCALQPGYNLITKQIEEQKRHFYVLCFPFLQKAQILDFPVQNQRPGHRPPHKARLVAPGGLWAPMAPTEGRGMTGDYRGNAVVGLWLRSAHTKHTRTSTFPTSRIFQENFSLGNRFSWKQYIPFPKLGSNGHALWTSLRQNWGLTWHPLWLGNTMGCAHFHLVAVSVKYNATNYPDFRFNINL